MKAQELRKVFTTSLTDEQIEKSAEYFENITGASPVQMPDFFKTHLENKEKAAAPNEQRRQGVTMDSKENWRPGVGGTETPFRGRDGKKYTWMWNGLSGEKRRHRYYCHETNSFLAPSEERGRVYP